MAKHITDKHHKSQFYRCACKKHFPNKTGFARHLAGLNDVAAHFAEAAILDAAGH